ncbi:DUF1028 domain-containing protein [Limosilactobacillus reuteri]|uniref:DUF1028 domain-containing protein n=1 Tax=Limosilactobacillus reuteri TaxID=1598 RepID=UPI001C0A9F48|nr:DUF1028 domain-containing protein [Limosilactobacillus reuteri]QWS05380.1 DUF1028 domain-containing protein [Limosilactobacillus reuteri]
MGLTNYPSTYSLIAQDNRAGLIGVITQSKYLAIGSLIHFFNEKVGLVVVQGKPEEKIATGIFNAYQCGYSPREAIRKVEELDQFSDYRQIAFLPISEKGSIFTGEKLKEVKVGVVRPSCISIGNFLKNKDVIYSIIEEFETNIRIDKFSNTLLNSLKMGLKQGGEKRGQQSAAIKIWKKQDQGYSKIMDLRVDDSEYAIEDLEELIKKYYLYMTPGNLKDSIENNGETHDLIERILTNASAKYADLGEKMTLKNLYRIENLESRWVSDTFIDREAFNFLKSKFL